MSRDFDGKVVAVTGASTGVGRAIAVEVASRGAAPAAVVNTASLAGVIGIGSRYRTPHPKAR